VGEPASINPVIADPEAPTDRQMRALGPVAVARRLDPGGRCTGC